MRPVRLKARYGSRQIHGKGVGRLRQSVLITYLCIRTSPTAVSLAGVQTLVAPNEVSVTTPLARRRWASQATLSATGYVSTRRPSPSLNISIADAWSRPTLSPHAGQSCLRSFSVFGTARNGRDSMITSAALLLERKISLRSSQRQATISRQPAEVMTRTI